MLICIDAGHCASTMGKRCLKSIDPAETREWVLNSRVAQRVQAGLTAYDCKTMRVDDPTGMSDVTLSSRVKVANAAQADVYLSIHHNAGIAGGAGGGTVVFVCPGAQAKSKALQKAIYDSTIAATGLRGNRANPMPQSNLYVLQRTTMPAVLIECGFMDSTTDVPIILTDKFAAQMAAGIVSALVAVLGLAKQAKTRRRLITYKKNGISVAEVPTEQLRLVMVDKKKESAIEGNGCNAGFFGNFSENGTKFTLPSGHLVCDMDAAGWAERYCGQRGRISNGKLRYPCGHWDKQFFGKAVSTLVIANGKAEIKETATLPACDYAIMGVPVLRDGKAVTFAKVKSMGFDASTLYATWHIFSGLMGACNTVYMVGLRTTSGNLISSGEAARKLATLGITDAIKIDGGGSYIFKVPEGKQKTCENRRINTIVDFGGNPWPTPVRTLTKGKRGDDVRWLQWELTDRGYPCDVDGSFGAGTESALRAYQRMAGLTVDGSCGSATKAWFIGGGL